MTNLIEELVATAPEGGVTNIANGPEGIEVTRTLPNGQTRTFELSGRDVTSFSQRLDADESGTLKGIFGSNVSRSAAIHTKQLLSRLSASSRASAFTPQT
jgi:hypothetical protein